MRAAEPGGGEGMAGAPDPWTAAMRRGDFATAFAIQAAGLARRDPASRDDPNLPYHLRWVWDGRSFEGRDVLVRCYHGLGDTLMFARFLPRLAARAASVTVEMQPRLLPLFRGFAGIDRLIPFDVAAPAPPMDCDIEIMELPLALGAGPQEGPDAPYLTATPAALPEGCIALCWEGGDWDRARNVPPALLAPLCRGPAVSLVPGPADLPVLNPRGCPLDMGLTARLVAGAALVVTVDTMTAHLAGALGRPVWLLARHDPDWRWPVDSARTPWYPTMRVWRQDRPGDWGGVMARMGAELAERAGR